MWLVAGLGNPGAEYAFTPHNLGFLVVDLLAEKLGARVTRPEAKALTGAGEIAGNPVLLAKPQTFMNLSGTSVGPLMKKHEIGLDKLILVYDELDVPWGQIKVRPKGSAGGHNGVKSVIEHLGTNDFSRVRLGIHPGHPIRDGAEFVLAPMKRSQVKELGELLGQAAEAVSLIIAEGVEKSMARFNRRAQG